MTNPAEAPRPTDFTDVAADPANVLFAAFDIPSDQVPDSGVTNAPTMFLQQTESIPDPLPFAAPPPPPMDPEDVDRPIPETFISDAKYSPVPPGSYMRPDDIKGLLR